LFEQDHWTNENRLSGKTGHGFLGIMLKAGKLGKIEKLHNF